MTAEDVQSWKVHIHGSPLYHRLADVVAADTALLAVLNRIEHVPKMNVLLAGVQYLLAEDDELASYYPTFVQAPRDAALIGPVFRSFVLDHQQELVHLGRTRYTQTNECRRCVALLPVVMTSGFSSFHLVDIGTSAGLNLALDRYHYRWGDIEWGGDGAPVKLETELRGSLPRLEDVEVLSRVGLDLHPVDPAKADDRRWLESLIWPEQDDRRRRLRAALELIQKMPARLIAGDALSTLPLVLEALPEGDPAVVLNSFSMNQMGREGRNAIDTIVRDARSDRKVFRVSMEILASQNEWATLRVDDGSGWRNVGQADPHGAFVEFYA